VQCEIARTLPRSENTGNLFFGMDLDLLERPLIERSEKGHQPLRINVLAALQTYNVRNWPAQPKEQRARSAKAVSTRTSASFGSHVLPSRRSNRLKKELLEPFDRSLARKCQEYLQGKIIIFLYVCMISSDFCQASQPRSEVIGRARVTPERFIGQP
jgi:hypothetical protein